MVKKRLKIAKKGFLMIEIVVALAILSLFLVSFLYVSRASWSATKKAVQRIDDLDRAIMEREWHSPKKSVHNN
jgi:type II secretory pathway pseudopilin PulG